MSLSGKLDVFPLEEVLRLLARSQQNGCLRVEGDSTGRIYMQEGHLTYATVESDEVLRDRLIAAGVVTDEGLSRLDISRGTLADALAPSAASSALTDLVREHSVESLYRIRRPEHGHFEFLADSTPRYPTGQNFDVESIISDSERRASEWADIESVVADLTTPWHMVPEIEEETVNLSDTAWRFLAAMDGSCSVEALAGRLGLTNFQTARRMAEMARARLVEPIEVVTYQTPVAATEPAAYDPVPEPEYQPEPEPEPTQVPAVSDPDRSWWADENSFEEEPSLGVTDVPAEAPVDEYAASEYVTDQYPTDALPTEDGTPVLEPQGEESFLETVFSELEKSEDSDEGQEDSEESGFGLLRRRGLGAAFRELADS